jgi:hypothetical protein
MDPDRGSFPPLQAVFEAATQFGLSDAEAWRIVDETMRVAGPEATLGEYLEELAAALASGILAKQRRRLRAARHSPSRVRG